MHEDPPVYNFQIGDTSIFGGGGCSVLDGDKYSSSWVNSIMKSARVFPFMVVLGANQIRNLLNSKKDKVATLSLKSKRAMEENC